MPYLQPEGLDADRRSRFGAASLYIYKKVGIFHVGFSRDWLSRFG